MMVPNHRMDDPVLTHEWMAVAMSSDVQDKPVKVRLLGEDLVLWRSLSGLHAFRDLCIHRGTALSLGRIEADSLVCPYHGWRFDSKGQCIEIPAQPDVAIPTKARAWNYHCQEKYGLVWVCLAEPARDIPAHPEFTEAYRTILCGPYDVNAEPPRIIENFLDVSHLMWVHEGYLGESSHAEIPDYRVHQHGDTLVSDTIKVFQPDPDGRGKVLNNNYVYSVFAPLTVHFKKTDDHSDEAFSIMLHVTPRDVRKSTAYAVLSRNYGFDMDDKVFQDFQNKIFSQDEIILLSQRPEELPLDLSAELHIKSDRLAIAYRKYLTDMSVKTGVT